MLTKFGILIYGRTYPLHLDLFLLFLLHVQEEIETKRGEMILLRALSHLGPLWAWAST